MRYTFRCRTSGWHKPQTAETIKDNLLCAGSTFFIMIIAIMAIVAVSCIQDMPAVSILLGALYIIMIFLLMSILKRAFGTENAKSD